MCAISTDHHKEEELLSHTRCDKNSINHGGLREFPSKSMFSATRPHNKNLHYVLCCRESNRLLTRPVVVMGFIIADCSWCVNSGCLFFFPKWGTGAKQHLLTGTASPATAGHPSTHLTSWHPKILTRPAQDFRRGTYILRIQTTLAIDRLSRQRRIEEGQYYEAHQQLRVVSQRYMKAGAHDAAIEILCSGARALLDAGQSGSGADLCLLLIEVYKAAQLAPDAVSKC